MSSSHKEEHMEDAYLTKLKSQNDDEISAALYTILHEPNKSKYFNEIIKHLNKGDLNVRLPATMILAKISNKNTIPYLEKMLNDNNKKIQIEAALGLAKYKNKKCYSVLKEVIEKDYHDHSIHKRSIEALGKFKDNNLLPIFKIGIYHRRKASRIKSIDALAKINSKESIVLLKEALGKEKEPEIKCRIKNILALKKF